MNIYIKDLQKKQDGIKSIEIENINQNREKKCLIKV